MDIRELLNRMNSHSIAIYTNEIEEVTENGKIVNWFLGLAGGGLLFSFNRYSSINSIDYILIITQALIFVSIIITGYLHRVFTKLFKSHTMSMVRMYDFLHIELEIVAPELKDDLDNKNIKDILYDYLNGNYFNESDFKEFERIGNKQIKTY